MAKCYGFDGWLVNIEVVSINVSDKDWADGIPLKEMLAQLKDGLKTPSSDGKLIW